MNLTADCSQIKVSFENRDMKSCDVWCIMCGAVDEGLCAVLYIH